MTRPPVLPITNIFKTEWTNVCSRFLATGTQILKTVEMDFIQDLCIDISVFGVEVSYACPRHLYGSINIPTAKDISIYLRSLF
jgi:hypothetical protein